MQQQENVSTELHFDYLSPDEIETPLTVLKEFVEDFSLSAVRKMMTTMNDICLTTESVFCGDARTREDMLYITNRVKKFMEASFLYLYRMNDEKLVVHDFLSQKNPSQVRKLRVCKKIMYPNGRGYTAHPFITLSGDWLIKAGFQAGDEVTVSHENQKILITIARQWDIAINDFKRRA